MSTHTRYSYSEYLSQNSFTQKGILCDRNILAKYPITKRKRGRKRAIVRKSLPTQQALLTHIDIDSLCTIFSWPQQVLHRKQYAEQVNMGVHNSIENIKNIELYELHNPIQETMLFLCAHIPPTENSPSAPLAIALEYFQMFLRQQSTSLGCVHTRDKLILVYAPQGETPSTISIPHATLLNQYNGATTNQIALHTLTDLIGYARLCHPKYSTQQIIIRSRKQQDKNTKKICEQSIEILRLWIEICNQSHIQPPRLYEDICNCTLALFGLLYMEANEILPIHHPIYRKYSLHNIIDSIQKDHTDTDETQIWNNIKTLLQYLDNTIDTSHELHNVSHGLQLPYTFVQTTTNVLFQPKIQPTYTQLREILYNLSHTDKHKLEYNTIYPETIGTIYENFLELSITAKSGVLQIAHTNKRSHTGAHYTPRILCDFTVRNAIEKKLSSTTPPSTEILSLKICDPAMGSGAFLLSAQRYLSTAVCLAWYRENNPLCLSPDLHGIANQHIRTSCLYGVDINPQAIEIGQFLLYLSCCSSTKNHDIMPRIPHIQLGNSLVQMSIDKFLQTLHTWLSPKFTKKMPIHDSSVLYKNLSRTSLCIDTWISIEHYAQNFRKKRRNKLRSMQAEKIYSILFGLSGFDTYTIPEEYTQEISLSTQPIAPNFHWQCKFPEIFASTKKGFDIIVANPPYINRVKQDVSSFFKNFLQEHYPLITGSGDISYYFLDVSCQLIHDTGVIGIILPRASMGAKALSNLRTHPRYPKPKIMYSPNHHLFFPNADIKIVVYVLYGQEGWCAVSDSPSPIDATWQETCIEYTNWWFAYVGNWWMVFSSATQQVSLPDLTHAISMSDENVEIYGGLTTDEFYKIQVSDQESGTNLKLLTSGGIDANTSLWGRDHCPQKFNKENYQFPRVMPHNYPPALQEKLHRSRRPKIIIANLTTSVEAFFDEFGEYQAATATQTIYHTNDDITKLRQICDILHSNYTQLLFTHALGYNAMNANISVEKHFLEHFPLLYNT